MRGRAEYNAELWEGSGWEKNHFSINNFSPPPPAITDQMWHFIYLNYRAEAILIFSASNCIFRFLIGTRRLCACLVACFVGACDLPAPSENIVTAR